MIVIINRKRGNSRIAYDVKRYCGRGSPLGNEFSHFKSTKHDSINVNNRDEACNLMRIQIIKYLLDSKDMFPKSKKIKEAFNEIYKIHSTGKTIALECFCKNRDDYLGINEGERCHVEDIKYIIDTVYNRKQDGCNAVDVLKELKEKWMI